MLQNIAHLSHKRKLNFYVFSLHFISNYDLIINRRINRMRLKVKLEVSFRIKNTEHARQDALRVADSLRWALAAAANRLADDHVSVSEPVVSDKDGKIVKV